MSTSSHRWVQFGGLTSGRIRGSNEGYLIVDSYPYATGANAHNRLYLNYNTPGDIVMAHGDGNVTIGTIPTDYVSTYKLHVLGDVSAANYTCNSDIRYKKNINQYKDALNKIIRLNGITFNWKTKKYKDKNFTEEMQVGFIAQEVEKVIPEIVRTDKQGYKSVTYSKLTAVLVEAIKELSTKNDLRELKAKKDLNELKTKFLLKEKKAELAIKALKAENEKLKKINEKTDQRLMALENAIRLEKNISLINNQIREQR